MGRQINFYTLTEDERAFVEFLSRKDALTFALPFSNTPGLDVSTPKKILGSNSSEIRKVLIINEGFPIEAQYIRKIHTKEQEGIAELVDLENESIYRVDTLNSTVIEWSRSRPRPDGQLAPGRIWAEMTRLEDGVIVDKDPGFIQWYERIARWLRKNYQRVEGQFRYFGPAAAKWYAEGGVLFR